ncbi:hypothetical protein ASPZODRAFT_71636 [Penicilliopsis zonata CBS 506.65]|uniref:Hemerythrin-like domain-containing protein n=1 Tax=Penicilliopsis zonata CBS 506.65 TaxID=1073090 RepID=A0A1L9SB21_9EURO|nr:hypothetical protein ASPZODRAFT_71636 [Penicilliopsis zonata CBS 506.65]OJJ44317.1 hypothetical protein ASPZODRAFT_71636 [Penicilliopsis zonata CBS 506.65]
MADNHALQPNFIKGQTSNQVRFFSEKVETPIPRIADVLRRDHHEIESVYDRILTSKDPDEQTRFQNQFTWEVARHAIGEELVVYPAFEKYLSKGGEMADRARREHQEMKEKLKEFQSLKSTDPQFHTKLKSLMADLQNHIEKEESGDLRRLEEVLSQPDSQGLSKSFDRTRMFVPSRSHPSAPNKPPFETVAGLLTAPMDRVADLFRKWPDETRFL